MSWRGRAGKIARCAVFLTGLAVALILLGKLLREKNLEYLSPEVNALTEDSADVLFLGPSTIMNGVYPLELWHEYGISAYNLGSGSQSFMASYYLLDELRERTKPRLLVLDCGKARSARAIVKIGYLHYVTDMLPLASPRRLQMIGIAARDRGYTLDEVAGLVAPVFAYHMRWQDLRRKDFSPDIKCLTRGAKVDDRKWDMTEGFAAYEADPAYSLPAISEEYLRKIIELCLREDIPLLMLTMPNMTPAVDVDQKEYELRIDAAAAVDRIAAEYGVTHLNLIREGTAIGLLPGEDTGDGQHLNYQGAPKFTAWLGDYIREHYRLADHRGESGYEAYDRQYETFQDYLAPMRVHS